MKPMMAIGAAAALLFLGSAAVAAAGEAPPGQPTFSFDWRGATGWLPLEITADRHVYFHLLVNGRDAVGMIDPNMPHTVIDAGFANRADIASGGLQIALPRLTIRGLTPKVSDLSALRTALGHPLDIVLGADAIDGVVADIDLLGHRLSLNSERGYIYPESARYTRLVRRGDAWLAPVSVEGRPAGLFALDTAAGDDLQIAPGYAREIGLAEAGGATHLRQIKFAGAVTTDVTADVGRQLPSAEAEGALGIGVLRCYRLMLDLQHDRLYTLVLDSGAAGPPIDWFELLRQNREPPLRPAPAF
jgi:hypothetical protein